MGSRANLAPQDAVKQNGASVVPASPLSCAVDALAARIERIDALLPQTQCTQCGYDGCLPYARAIALGDAPINRCPPGGESGVAALAELLEQAPIALDRSRGEPGPLTAALIDEQHCIGCTLCIKVCPVDAIVGANKRMHTVIADICTGCGLCVAPCPVDCIAMTPVTPARNWCNADADAARQRHRARAIRLQHDAQQAQARLAARSTALKPERVATDDARKQATIAAALARARARRTRTQERP